MPVLQSTEVAEAMQTGALGSVYGAEYGELMALTAEDDELLWSGATGRG